MLDAGASTGGFTDVLLRRGAAHVVAVDVGYGQLAWSLQQDERVTVVDRTNVRELDAAAVGELVDVVVADLSFISLRLVLRPLRHVARADADLVLMVEPQFEVGRERLGAGGVVRDPTVRADAVREVVAAALEVGLGEPGRHGKPAAGAERQRRVLRVAAGGRGPTGRRRARAGRGARTPRDRGFDEPASAARPAPRRLSAAPRRLSGGAPAPAAGAPSLSVRHRPATRRSAEGGRVLLEMRLRGLGVIADAVLELGPGLTVVTGETGAGKTMVVTGLGLLMGGKADPASVRKGHGTATVEGRVLVDPHGPAAERAVEAGAELDDGDVLIVTRTVSAEARGRTHLGGRSVPVGVLAEIAEHLVTVHGQSDQIRLRLASRQREALDRFAGPDMSEALAAYRATWQRLGTWRAGSPRSSRRRGNASRRQSSCASAWQRSSACSPSRPRMRPCGPSRPGSVDAEELRTAAQNAHLALTGDPDGPGTPDVAVLLAQARRALDQVAAHDPALAGLAARLEEVGYLVADVAAECASYADAVEADPARLAASRSAGPRCRRSPAPTAAMSTRCCAAAEAAPRLLELDGDEDRTTELHAQREQLRATLAEHAAQLTRRRADAATALGDAGVRRARRPLDARRPARGRRGPPRGPRRPRRRPRGPEGAVRYAAGPDGIDEVEFLLVPHPGAPPRPIARGASGGELSRVMLGLEVVLAAADPVPTFVFDEVDAGVGGRAALGIGRRLARLARTSQVLVVTHLAQVAAFADRHLTVVKSSDGEVTVSGVTSLDGPGLSASSPACSAAWRTRTPRRRMPRSCSRLPSRSGRPRRSWHRAPPAGGDGPGNRGPVNARRDRPALRATIIR